MNISDFQHSENIKKMHELQNKGFTFVVNPRGYSVSFNGEYISGAGTLKKPHGRYAKANLRDYLNSALSVARQHEKQQCQ